jgi:regulator of cell morphogenesis and NO signaling
MTQAALTPDVAPIDDAAALTLYIEKRYHQRHREQLPQLAEQAERIEMVHAGAENLPAGLSAILRRLIGEMEVHMKKEELILFPAIRAGGHPGLEHPIAEMRTDHDHHEADVERIRAITGGPSLPEGACRSWTRLYAGVEEFISDLNEHIRLENEVLFPQFEQATA